MLQSTKELKRNFSVEVNLNVGVFELSSLPVHEAMAIIAHTRRLPRSCLAGIIIFIGCNVFES
jgi:hypothetical protein